MAISLPGPGNFSTIAQPRRLATTRSASASTCSASTANCRGSERTPAYSLAVSLIAAPQAISPHSQRNGVGLVRGVQHFQPVVEAAPPHLPLGDEFERAIGR